MVGVESTTLVQHCPYVNILSLAVGSITSWNQYVGPTFGQCTPVVCFNMTDLRWVHYVGPTLAYSNTCTLTLCWLQGVGPTLFLLIGPFNALTCWLYVVPSCWHKVRPTFTHGKLAHCWQVHVGPTYMILSGHTFDGSTQGHQVGQTLGQHAGPTLGQH